MIRDSGSTTKRMFIVTHQYGALACRTENVIYWSARGRTPDSQPKGIVFEYTLLPFRSLSNFVLSQMHQFTKLNQRYV